MQKILITPRSFRHYRQDAYPLLEQANYEIVENDRGRVLSEQEMIDACKETVGAIVGLDPVTSRVLRACPSLRAISKYGSGMDNIDLQEASRLGIKVMNAAGSNSVSVAELAVAYLFSLSRNMCWCVNGVKEGRWDRTMGREVTGKTLGVIGCGRIGREVVKRAAGLGMRVLINDDWFDDREFLSAHAARRVDFGTLLEESDFVTLHCPLTPETRGLMGAEAFRQMKDGACLVNVARGEIVDEEALYEALSSGKLAGAAQDVFSTEPPEADHPLLKLDNFLLTPHIGGYTEEAVRQMALISTRNLLEMLRES